MVLPIEVSPTLYVIYDHPRDFPNSFVCRIFHGELPEALPLIVASKLEDIYAILPPGLTNIGREPEDDPVIREVWIDPRTV